jgi:hypothetical protein
MSATLTTLDAFLEPLTGCMTPEMARQIIEWKPDPELQARIQELGQKANEGTLTPDEQAEYEGFIDDGDVIALFQAKARHYLNQTAS